MDRARHSALARSPRYNAWRYGSSLLPKTPLGWCNNEAGARQDLDAYDRASNEVRIAALDHKVNEIGIMVAQIYGSLGMTGQLPEQIKQAQLPQRRRPPVGFGQ